MLEDNDYSFDGPQHHPVELGWSGFDYHATGAIYTFSDNSIYVRRLVYGGEPALSQMRSRHSPGFLLGYSDSQLHIPIHVGSVRCLEFFRPNKTILLSRYFDELTITHGDEVFENVKSVHNLTIGPRCIKSKEYPFVTGTVTIRDRC